MRLAIFMCPLLASLAAAAEPGPPPPDPAHAEADAPTWSLGAGVGVSLLGTPPTAAFLSGVFDGSQPAMAPFVTNSSSPAASLLVERRLSAGSWLMLRATAAHSTTSFSSAANGTSTSTFEADETDLSLSLGIRAVLFTRSRVQLSGILLGGVGYTTIQDNTPASPDGSTPASTLGWKAYVGSISVGVGCDVFLMSNLALRVSTPLLALSYDQASSSSTQNPTSSLNQSDFSGGLVLAPTLELRVLF